MLPLQILNPLPALGKMHIEILVKYNISGTPKAIPNTFPG
jgi:hypothetical protein